MTQQQIENLAEVFWAHDPRNTGISDVDEQWRDIMESVMSVIQAAHNDFDSKRFRASVKQSTRPFWHMGNA